MRASYAMFASQLGNYNASIASDVSYYRYIYYYPVDRNGNKYADYNEIDPQDYGYWYGFDITDPSAKTKNKITRLQGSEDPRADLRLRPRAVQELRRERLGHVAQDGRLQLDAVHRRAVRATTTRVAPTRPPTFRTVRRSPHRTTVLDTTGVPDDTLDASASEFTKRDGYHQRFLGFEAMATKRLSNKWMARFGFSTNNHTEYFDNPATAIGDPTKSPAGPEIDGGIVVVSSTGSGKSGIYQLLPKYQFIGNGLYQLPYNIDVGVNWILRQGFGQPWYRSRVPGSGDALSGTKQVLFNTDLNTNRLPYVSTVDIRIGYRLKLGRTSLNFDFDTFNLLNSATVLGRQYDYRLTGTTGFNQTLEIMNPRIMRLGLRFNF